MIIVGMAAHASVLSCMYVKKAFGCSSKICMREKREGLFSIIPGHFVSPFTMQISVTGTRNTPIKTPN